MPRRKTSRTTRSHTPVTPTTADIPQLEQQLHQQWHNLIQVEKSLATDAELQTSFVHYLAIVDQLNKARLSTQRRE